MEFDDALRRTLLARKPTNKIEHKTPEAILILANLLQ